MPGVPVLANDVPGYESASMMGLFAPAKLPPAMVQLLHREIVRVLKQPEVTERLFGTGVEVIGNSPSEFAATVKSEMNKWGKLIKDGRLREDIL